ncbi:hypothetical protein ACHAWF_005836 [Thalassiosira exigua]
MAPETAIVRACRNSFLFAVAGTILASTMGAVPASCSTTIGHFDGRNMGFSLQRHNAQRSKPSHVPSLLHQTQSERASCLGSKAASLRCEGMAFVTRCSSSRDASTLKQQFRHWTAPAVPADATRLRMSSSASPRQSHSSRGRRTQQTRNRGANAANHNRRGHSFRLNGDGSTKKSNTKRAPRWEREGDRLYAEVSKQLDSFEGNAMDDGKVSVRLASLSNRRIKSAHDVCELLEPWMAFDEKKQKGKNEEDDDGPRTNETTDETNKKTPPFLWGSLPVGPVLASRLHASQRSSPTSVQRAAFPILTTGHSKGNKKVSTKRANAIIASPTGTGKTLAYLLPILCTSPGGQSGEGTGGVLIVTPTIELACQIQREVNMLWPPSEGNDSSCFVVGADDVSYEDGETRDDSGLFEDITPGRLSLRSIKRAPLIAGTPKMLRMLYREASRVVAETCDGPSISEEERITSKELISNLRTIVLDEADRLLRTEAVARESIERKKRKIAQRKAAEAEEVARDSYIPAPPALKKKKLVIARQTQAELLLRDLPIASLNDVQIICASATIGRTMRRQLMQILDAPSADAAATLVTGDSDERVKSKDAERRKSVLLPERLQHAFRVVDGEGLIQKENPSQEFPDSTLAERNEEMRSKATIETLLETMSSVEAKPIIIFPGRIGVDHVQKELVALGLNDIRTLRNLDGKSPEEVIHNDDSAADITDGQAVDNWKSTPIYVIGERFARGLDLPDVEYVFMLSPPSSAAGYAHMAGRTGRSGRAGTAITLVRPKNNEVQRIAAIAEALGLKFVDSISGAANENTHSGCVVVDASESSSDEYPWALLSESAIKRKKNSELYDYLLSFGVQVSKQAKKADLVTAIGLLHSSR